MIGMSYAAWPRSNAKFPFPVIAAGVEQLSFGGCAAAVETARKPRTAARIPKVEIHRMFVAPSHEL
jgi:hypothetical protein